MEARPAPYRIEAELLYQPLGYRWTENLRQEVSAEARAFGCGFDAVAAWSFQRLAGAVHEGGPSVLARPPAVSAPSPSVAE